jgi:hypothetical protein
MICESPAAKLLLKRGGGRRRTMMRKMTALMKDKRRFSCSDNMAEVCSSRLAHRSSCARTRTTTACPPHNASAHLRRAGQGRQRHRRVPRTAPALFLQGRFCFWNVH